MKDIATIAAYRVRPVFVALKVDHTIYTSEGGAVTSTAMGIEFFLGEDITAGLDFTRQNQSVQFHSSQTR